MQNKQFVAVWSRLHTAHEVRASYRAIQLEIEVGIECACVGVYPGQSSNRLTADGDEVTAQVKVVTDLLDGQHHCRCVGGEASVQVAKGVKFGHAQREIRGSVGFPTSKATADVESVVCGVGL